MTYSETRMTRPSGAPILDARVLMNSAANYVGQICVIGISFFSAPVYLKYMGAEAFGLVGVLALIQGLGALIDLGLTPTLTRRFASSGPQKPADSHDLLRVMEMILCAAVSILLVTLYPLSWWLAHAWLKVQSMDRSSVAQAVFLIGIIFSLQWGSGLYRGALIGRQDQIWLNCASVLFAACKFGLAYCLLAFLSGSAVNFFRLHAGLSAIELIFLCHRVYARHLLKGRDTSLSKGISEMRVLLPFAGATAYGSILWILITQIDKLTLSATLSLREFGFLNLVTILAGAITLICQPIGQAILPRLIHLSSTHQKEALIRLYRTVSQAVVLVAFAAALILATNSDRLLSAWTGSHEVGNWGRYVLGWFALGNAFMALSALQYYLQQAAGTMRLHVAGSTISAVVQVPLVVFAAREFGALGAAAAWFGFRLLWFLWWTPIIHRRYLPGVHLQWLRNDIVPVLVFLIMGTAVLYIVPPLAAGRASTLLDVIGRGGILLCFGSLGMRSVRTLCLQRIRRAL